MIELQYNELVFTFPEIHPLAQLSISFQRTLRIPDDDITYPLPPSLGQFPLRHVDDYSSTVPPAWVDHGGIFLPMYQSEALWINFDSDYLAKHDTSYPFAVKLATGKIDAVAGTQWKNELSPSPQDYVVVPEQPWIDGYCVGKELIRQFVAMPLGSGYSAEEQITGVAEHGGIQLIVYPMKRSAFDRLFPEKDEQFDFMFMEEFHALEDSSEYVCEMGLAPGGKMHQEIYEDPYGIDVWDQDVRSRCFVHLANSLDWRAITGEKLPSTPCTAQQYARHGLPWFDYYNDSGKPVTGSHKLTALKSVYQMGKDKNEEPLPENESIEINGVNIIGGRQPGKKVREGEF